MKATTWLCPVLILLGASTGIICTTAQRSHVSPIGSDGYPLDYADTNMIQDEYLLEKRNKPSLSIVNPLDVLRQRLLLEIARRQMKENTRQVELNRAILKNVGKRQQMPASHHYQMSYEQQQQPQQQQQQDDEQLQQQRQYLRQQRQQKQRQAEHQQQQQLLQRHQYDLYPFEYPYVGGQHPMTSIFDFIQQRPATVSAATTRGDGGDIDERVGGFDAALAAAAIYEAALLDETKKSLENDINSSTRTSTTRNTGSSTMTKYQQNGNENRNETNHATNNQQNGHSAAVSVASNVPAAAIPASNRQLKQLGIGGSTGFGSQNTFDDNSIDDDESIEGLSDGVTNVSPGYTGLRYLYRLHRNHYARK